MLIFANAAELARGAADKFSRIAQESFPAKQRFTVALSGGSTPRAMYTLLAEQPYRSQLAWDRIDFFWGDERAVPADHPESNFRMTNEALLSKIPVPAENIHRIKGEVD